MRPLGSAVFLAIGLALSGCAGTLDGFSTSSSEMIYPATSYYGAPIEAQGYYPEPTYGAPYGYSSPYGRREGWQEHEWQEHRGQGFRNEGRPAYIQQGQGGGNIARPVAQPRGFPAAPAPQAPPPARPQADTNRKLIDQLGFRPSR